MALSSTTVQERRKFTRGLPPSRLAIQLVRPEGILAADYVNGSEGGLCLRLQETLEVRSLVRLEVLPGHASRRLACQGRVAWVMQRLDLRGIPPFLFDVGIEFINPPPALRHWLTRHGGHVNAAVAGSSAREKALEPSVIRGRRYLPQLRREPDREQPWHLVVSVDGLPCFSGRYSSERAALTAWNAFKRQPTKR